MKKAGWYSMKRGWMDHEVFRKTPYSQREAWIWLIENAVYEERTVNISGRPVVLQRGQLSYSVRFLAEAWKWTESRTQRFMNKLKSWGMIETKSDMGQQIITICNYSKYQDHDTKNDTNKNKETSKQINKPIPELEKILESTVQYVE